MSKYDEIDDIVKKDKFFLKETDDFFFDNLIQDDLEREPSINNTGSKYAKNNPLIRNNKNKHVIIPKTNNNKVVVKILILLTVISTVAGSLAILKDSSDESMAIVDTIEFDQVDEILANTENHFTSKDIHLLITQKIDNYLSEENLSEKEKRSRLENLLSDDKESAHLKSLIVDSVIKEFDFNSYIAIDYEEVSEDIYQKLITDDEFMQEIKKQSARFAIPEEVLLGISLCQTITTNTVDGSEKSIIVDKKNIMNINYDQWNKYEELRSVYSTDGERIYLKDFRMRSNNTIADNVEYATAIFKNSLTQSNNVLLNESSFSIDPNRPKDAFDYYFYKDIDLNELSDSQRTELVDKKRIIVNVMLKYSGDIKTAIEYQDTIKTSTHETNLILSNFDEYLKSYYDEVTGYIDLHVQSLAQTSSKNL